MVKINGWATFSVKFTDISSYLSQNEFKLRFLLNFLYIFLNFPNYLIIMFFKFFNIFSKSYKYFLKGLKISRTSFVLPSIFFKISFFLFLLDFHQILLILSSIRLKLYPHLLPTVITYVLI